MREEILNGLLSELAAEEAEVARLAEELRLPQAIAELRCIRTGALVDYLREVAYLPDELRAAVDRCAIQVNSLRAEL